MDSDRRDTASPQGEQPRSHAGNRRSGGRCDRGRTARPLRPDDRHDRRLREGAPPIRETDRELQAVKHLLANAAVKLEFARPVVYAAAWQLDQRDAVGSDQAGGADASRSASAAKAYASDAASEAARVALQVHGAIGYTWECDVHLFLKRAWALTEAWGSASDHRQRMLGVAHRRQLTADG